ncbi:hypothetical protein TASIC1_0010025400 [Trichoderma asperellum]|uniref:Uncharacterized protein n=1 Tax=Trichoderma asperellum TaxID=101201 RepID=A0A6V8R753_TRIAP|nr:hypothetical protein TASIC1_0010025400 [Trichoderma asperellum]
MNQKTMRTETETETETQQKSILTTQATRLKTQPKSHETNAGSEKPPLLVPAQPRPPCHQPSASHTSTQQQQQQQQPMHHHQQQLAADSESASVQQQPPQQAPAASSPTRS